MELGTTDLAFIWIGSLMTVAGCVLYFILEIWKNLRDSDPVFPAVMPALMSLGITVATNGLIGGFVMQMSPWLAVVIFVIMLISLVWCIFAVRKLVKLTYGKTTRV